MRIWRNGQIVETAGAIDAMDRGVLLGDGIFETVAFIAGRPLRLDKHIARLCQGAAILGIPVPFETDDMTTAIAAITEEEGVSEGSVRMTLLRGSGPRGVMPPDNPEPTLLISAQAGTVGVSAPLRAILSTVTRRNEHSPLSRIKSTNYLDAILARREASSAGADDAILLNTKGMISEASAANVFCRFGEALVTPPLADGALPGIMRQCVIDQEGAAEQSVSASDVFEADEIFLTSSLSVRAVIQLDGKDIGNGSAGPVATRLVDLPHCAL